jgi:thioredoxin-related protein
MKNFLLFLIFCLISMAVHAQSRTNSADQPTELGKVSWLRDYDAALAEAKRTDKPVLILFQEVPGCSTCQQYGNVTLSHPLMVEAIENEFVPLAIFNNKKGNDAKVLAKYGEPAWNNPVVRIVDAQGKDIVDRLAGNYTPKGLFTAMTLAQLTTNRTIPGYLEVLGLELTAAERAEEATFQMYCFWSGEHHLGNHAGVLTTEPGFMNGHEVVRVKYDPAKVSPTELASYAIGKNIKPAQPAAGYRIAEKDHYYQIKKTDYAYLPLTEVQKTKLNAAVGRGKDLNDYLSPRQLAYLAEVKGDKAGKEKLWQLDFVEAWGVMKGLKE